jgi:hypothetical protein
MVVAAIVTAVSVGVRGRNDGARGHGGSQRERNDLVAHDSTLLDAPGSCRSAGRRLLVVCRLQRAQARSGCAP